MRVAVRPQKSVGQAVQKILEKSQISIGRFVDSYWFFTLEFSVEPPCDEPDWH